MAVPVKELEVEEKVEVLLEVEEKVEVLEGDTSGDTAYDLNSTESGITTFLIRLRVSCKPATTSSAAATSLTVILNARAVGLFGIYIPVGNVLCPLTPIAPSFFLCGQSLHICSGFPQI